MIKYIFMLVLVLISSPVFSQLPATTGNRIYAEYGEFTHDYTDATALDKDPPTNDLQDADTILKASSLTKAQNLDTGVHSWTAKSWINCFNAQYKGTWVLQHHTPHIVEESMNANKGGNFNGVFNKDGYVRGEIAGARDCRISIREAKAAGSISGNKIKASGSQVGDEVWANTFIPWRVAPGDDPDLPKLGISPADPKQTPQPGDSVTLNLVTSEPYYDISLYAKAPWETSERGTFVENVSGDGTSTKTSFSYTFPSGAMHTGDFLFTAVIYRWSDMSSYEETYTVTVSNPTTPGTPLSVSASPGPGKWSVSLSWAVPSSDGGSAITGYQYQYRRYYAGTWESWSSWQSVSSTSTTVTGLISNGTYEFRVRAVNSVGTGSITDSVTTTAR